MPGLVMLGSQAAGWVRGRASLRSARVRRRAAAVVPELPAGLDAATLLDAARDQFMRLQAAWDAGDMALLGALTTPQMLDELRSELPAAGSPPNRTDVLSLQARLLGVDDLGSVWLATIEFTGTVRECPERGPAAFRELWLMTSERPTADRTSDMPWRLARQQALL